MYAEYVKPNRRMVIKVNPTLYDEATPLPKIAVDEVRNILLSRVPNSEEGDVTVMQGIIIAMAKKALDGNLNAATTLMQWYTNGIDTAQQVNTNMDLTVDPIMQKMLRSIGVTV